MCDEAAGSFVSEHCSDPVCNLHHPSEIFAFDGTRTCWRSWKTLKPRDPTDNLENQGNESVDLVGARDRPGVHIPALMSQDGA
jgi:hypothetical protein